jgi:hypothetical protein
MSDGVHADVDEDGEAEGANSSNNNTRSNNAVVTLGTIRLAVELARSTSKSISRNRAVRGIVPIHATNQRRAARSDSTPGGQAEVADMDVAAEVGVTINAAAPAADDITAADGVTAADDVAAADDVLTLFAKRQSQKFIENIPAVCSRTVQLVVAATCGWSRVRHALHHQGVRTAVHALLLVSERLRRQFYAIASTTIATTAITTTTTLFTATGNTTTVKAFGGGVGGGAAALTSVAVGGDGVSTPLLPPEMWLAIMSYFLRRDWAVPLTKGIF